MFERFGNMNSAEEINAKARELRESKDAEGLRVLAEENGIEPEIIEMFLDEQELGFICDETTAAVGKLEVEAEDLKAAEIIEDWVEYIKAQCMDDTELAGAVRRKDKSLVGCIGELLRWSWDNSYTVDKRVVKAAGIKGNQQVRMGIPGMGRAKKTIRDYYLGKQVNA